MKRILIFISLFFCIGYPSFAQSTQESFEKGVSYANSGNYTEAMKWFLKIADLGYDAVEFNLGICYEKTKNYAEAIKWYTKAAYQGNAEAEAQVNLGNCYKREKNTQKQ